MAIKPVKDSSLCLKIMYDVLKTVSFKKKSSQNEHVFFLKVRCSDHAVSVPLNSLVCL